MAIDTAKKRRRAINFSIMGSLPPTPSLGIDDTDRAHLLWNYYSSQVILVESVETYTHLWDFGDGEQSAEQNPRHAYSMVGKYTISHTVTDQKGNSETETKEDYVTLYPWAASGGSGRDVSKTGKCFRYGFNTDQGLGFSECSGDGFPFPEGRVGVISVYDESYYPHLLVMDYRDGMLYDITTFNGPSGSGQTKVWKDKVDTSGSGGTDIIPEVTFREDTGEEEDYFLRSNRNHFFTRPINEDNRGASGYDANGYPTGLELDISIFTDGEQTTAKATAADISIPKHMISYDKKVEGNRIYSKIVGNKAEFRVMERIQKYVVMDTPAAPDNMLMNHDDWQRELACPTLWLGYSRNNLVNRYTGIPLSLIGITRIAGLDGNTNSAIEFDTAQNLGSVSLSSGTLMLWYQGTIGLTIGGNAVALTIHDTSGGWTLGYAETVTESGDMVITPTGIVDIFDLRAFNAAVSSGARTYYFNDVDGNSGDIVLPGI